MPQRKPTKLAVRKVERKPYSVLLLYPSWSNGTDVPDGRESFYHFAMATDAIHAVKLAKRECIRMNDASGFKPDDLVPILVTQGHNPRVVFDHEGHA